MMSPEHFHKSCSDELKLVDSSLFGFWLRFGSVTGFSNLLLRRSPAENQKILAAHRYIFSVNALSRFLPVARKNFSFKSSAVVLAGIVLQVTALVGRAADTQELREWENPRLTGLSNQSPHATMVICPDAATARKIQFVANSERVKSSFYRSLNGSWKYHYSSNQLARVPEFWSTNFDDRAWDKIEVPSNV